MTPAPSEIAMALFGTSAAEPETIELVAGALSAEFSAGNLRNIRFAGVEVLRAIAYVIRDEDWGTYAPRLSSLEIQQETESFRVTYDASCEARNGARLEFSAVILGRADGSLRFEATAQPTGDFRTNRCGFCVLHPIVGLAGSPVVVEHVDGSLERTQLPDLIDPWQPFQSMRAITHAVRPGLAATCRLDGDTFEMEDQRNWSDASYKTYVRPLELPWPYVLKAGEASIQSVTLTLQGDATSARAPTAKPEIVVAVGAPIGAMPKLGLIVTPEQTNAILSRLDRLAAVGPQVLTLHFDATAGHGREALAGFAEIARRTQTEITLECVVPCRDDISTELHAVAALVRETGLRLDAIAVSPSVDRQSTPPGSAWPACPPLSEVYAAARAAFPGVRLGGGSFSYFTELNRKRPPVGLLDFVTHATNPIVHAADDRSVMQTLEALPFITRSARAFIGADKPYRIGPSTLAMRQNPYGSRTFDNPDDRRIAMANADPRHNALFGAAWTLGYVAQTAQARLEVLTPAALTGAFGLFDETGAARPLFHVVQALAALAGQEWLAFTCSHPEAVQGFAVARVVWLANLTPRPLRVQLPAGGERMLRKLDAETESAASRLSGGVVEMAPHAVVEIAGGHDA